ncbi:MAG: NAD-binding protein, partial [Pseudorhodoplanes sp.]
FVSVGMLFDPMIVVRDPWPVLATLVIIVFGKSIAAFAIVRLFGHPNSTALTISASLAQIGEFSFILVGLGMSLALLPERGRDLVLAGAILSILLNPIVFAILDRVLRAAGAPQSAAGKPAESPAPRQQLPVTALQDHVVLVGYGRVGRVVSEGLRAAGIAQFVIEDNADAVARLAAAGVEAVAGNAVDPELIRAANLPASRCLLVAIPDAFEGGQAIEKARRLAPALRIIARSHSEEETEHLLKHGASEVVMGEREIARAMLADLGIR